MSDVVFEVIDGRAGACLAVFDGGVGHRLAGPKPWGGGRTAHRFTVSRDELLAQIVPPEHSNDEDTCQCDSCCRVFPLSAITFGAGGKSACPECRAPDSNDEVEREPVAEVFVGGLEQRIVRAQAERDARLTIDEARERLLKAIDGARQALVKPTSIVGDLFADDPAIAESRQNAGVQVIALKDFNDALDTAFPAATTPTSEERDG